MNNQRERIVPVRVFLREEVVTYGEHITRTTAKIGDTDTPRVIYHHSELTDQEIAEKAIKFDGAKELLDDPNIGEILRRNGTTPRREVRRRVSNFVDDVKAGNAPFSDTDTGFSPLIEQRAMRRLYRLAKNSQKTQK